MKRIIQLVSAALIAVILVACETTPNAGTDNEFREPRKDESLDGKILNENRVTNLKWKVQYVFDPSHYCVGDKFFLQLQGGVVKEFKVKEGSGGWDKKTLDTTRQNSYVASGEFGTAIFHFEDDNKEIHKAVFDFALLPHGKPHGGLFIYDIAHIDGQTHQEGNCVASNAKRYHTYSAHGKGGGTGN